MAKPPNSRGFTIAEKRGLVFEHVSLYAVLGVALIAAAISFRALSAVGHDMGLGPVAVLLPVAVDGFGIACSVGIVRSVASGDGFRRRVSEWVGLSIALALSVLGNITHALAVGAASLPDYVKVSYATAIPIIVAYGLHVYGRAMSKGISAHVLADQPDQLVRDLWHLDDAQPAARTRTVRTPVSAQPVPRNARADIPAAQSRARTDAQPDARAPRTNSAAAAAIRDAWLAQVRAHPDARPSAKSLYVDLGLTAAELSESQARRIVQQLRAEHEAAMGTADQDPIVRQVEDDVRRGEQAPQAESVA